MALWVRIAKRALLWFLVGYPVVAVCLLIPNALFPEADIFFVIPAGTLSPTPSFFALLAAIGVPVNIGFAIWTLGQSAR